MIIDNGAYPSPLGYGGFPKSVCTSVNECICHGIPDSRPLEVYFINDLQFSIHCGYVIVFLSNLIAYTICHLQDGDIINIDVTVYLNVSISVSCNFQAC